MAGRSFRWLCVQGVPTEVVTLGRPLNQRVDDVLFYVCSPWTSNGRGSDQRPLAHLRAPRSGFGYPINSIGRSPVESGMLKPYDERR
jgi:hypothetical protein